MRDTGDENQPLNALREREHNGRRKRNAAGVAQHTELLVAEMIGERSHVGGQSRMRRPGEVGPAHARTIGRD